MGHAETALDALSAAHDAVTAATAQRFEAAEQRLTDVEHVARAADSAALRLADAHEALKFAVADDFSALAQDTVARLNAGLEEMRASADDAAAEAEAAAVHVVAELRRMRETLDARLAESAAETRGRMQAAFADASEQLAALTDRVVEHERHAAYTADQLRAQIADVEGGARAALSETAGQLRTRIADVEDSAQVALEETAETLRRAGAALAAEFERTAAEQQAALYGVRTELGADIAAIRDEHDGALARLKVIDVALVQATNDAVALRTALDQRFADAAAAADAGLQEARAAAQRAVDEAATLRETLERRAHQIEASARAALAGVVADWDARFDALAARADEAEETNLEARRAAAAETERVEACTLAALEKLAGDIVSGNAALRTSLAQVGEASETALRQGLERFEGELSRLRDTHIGAAARLRLIDKALGEHDINDAPISERLARIEDTLEAQSTDPEILARLTLLEQAADKAETEQAIAVLRQALSGLSDQVAGLAAGDGLRQELLARIDACDAQLATANEGVHSVARALKQSAQDTDDRLQKVELALADLRLDQFAAADHSGALAEIESRLVGMEERQAASLAQLRDDIENFIGANDRRLAALEGDNVGGMVDDLADAIDARFRRLESFDFAVEFQELRRRLDDRILGVEQRSVRALEQVAETVAVIERRFHGRDDENVARTA